MRLKLAACLLAFALPALPVSAAALNYHDLLAIKQACGNDIHALCVGVSRGQGRIAQCMMAHADAVSPPCARVLKAATASCSTIPTDGMGAASCRLLRQAALAAAAEER